MKHPADAAIALMFAAMAVGAGGLGIGIALDATHAGVRVIGSVVLGLMATACVIMCIHILRDRS